MDECPAEKPYIFINSLGHKECSSSCHPAASDSDYLTGIAQQIYIRFSDNHCIETCPGIFEEHMNVDTVTVDKRVCRDLCSATSAYPYRGAKNSIVQCVASCPGNLSFSNPQGELECITSCPPAGEPTKVLIFEGTCASECPLYNLSNQVCVDECPAFDPNNVGNTNSYEYDTTYPAKGVTTGIKYCVTDCATHVDPNGNSKAAYFISPTNQRRFCTEDCTTTGTNLIHLEDGICKDSCNSGLYLETNKICVGSCPITEPYIYRDDITGKSMCTDTCKLDKPNFYVDNQGIRRCISACPPESLAFALLTHSSSGQCVTDCDVFNVATCTDTTPAASSAKCIENSGLPYIYKIDINTSLCVNDCASTDKPKFYINNNLNKVCTATCPPDEDSLKSQEDNGQCINNCNPNFHLNGICRANCDGIPQNRFAEDGTCVENCSDHPQSVYQAETGQACLNSCPTLRFETDPKRCVSSCDYYKNSVCYDGACPDAGDLRTELNECVQTCP